MEERKVSLTVRLEVDKEGKSLAYCLVCKEPIKYYPENIHEISIKKDMIAYLKRNISCPCGNDTNSVSIIPLESSFNKKYDDDQVKDSGRKETKREEISKEQEGWTSSIGPDERYGVKR